MPKPFPENISLKKEKCPKCGDTIGVPPLRTADAVVQAYCRKNCGHTVDLFWLGDAGRN